MITRFIILCFCLATLFCSVVAEVIDVAPCGGLDLQCIKEVRITPCKEAKLKKPCKIKKTTDASIEVDFVPNFNSEHLKSQAYWDNGFIDIPFLGMNTNACNTTACPIVEGRKQTYTLNLPISSSYPNGPYTVKWKLSGDEAGQGCCFEIKIKIIR